MMVAGETGPENKGQELCAAFGMDLASILHTQECRRITRIVSSCFSGKEGQGVGAGE